MTTKNAAPSLQAEEAVAACPECGHDAAMHTSTCCDVGDCRKRGCKCQMGYGDVLLATIATLRKALARKDEALREIVRTHQPDGSRKPIHYVRMALDALNVASAALDEVKP